MTYLWKLLLMIFFAQHGVPPETMVAYFDSGEIASNYVAARILHGRT